MIEDQAALEAFCQRAASALSSPSTRICPERPLSAAGLVRVASDDEAVAIDPLTPDMDLAPLFALMTETSMPKVFHAAGQDLEIFANLTGTLPSPLFDTQIAAMVCGFEIGSVTSGWPAASPVLSWTRPLVTRTGRAAR